VRAVVFPLGEELFLDEDSEGASFLGERPLFFVSFFSGSGAPSSGTDAAVLLSFFFY